MLRVQVFYLETNVLESHVYILRVNKCAYHVFKYFTLRLMYQKVMHIFLGCMGVTFLTFYFATKRSWTTVVTR